MGLHFCLSGHSRLRLADEAGMEGEEQMSRDSDAELQGSTGIMMLGLKVSEVLGVGSNIKRL